MYKSISEGFQDLGKNVCVSPRKRHISIDYVRKINCKKVY